MKSRFLGKMVSVVGLTAMAIGMVGCGSDPEDYTASDMLELVPENQPFIAYVDCGNYIASDFFSQVETAVNGETTSAAEREKYKNTKAVIFNNGAIVYHKGSSDSDFAQGFIEDIKEQAALMPNDSTQEVLVQLDNLSTQTIKIEGKEVIVVSGNDNTEIFFMELANDLFLIAGSQQSLVAFIASEKGISENTSKSFNAAYKDENILTVASYTNASGDISIAVSAVDSLKVDATLTPVDKAELEKGYKEISQGVAMIPMILSGVDPELGKTVPQAIKVGKTDSSITASLDLDAQTAIKLLLIAQKMAEQQML